MGGKMKNNRPALLLLQPPGACRSFTRSESCYPPLGLCQLAAMVAPSEVVVLDADGLQLSHEETIKKIVDINPIAVGMTLTSYTFELIEEYITPLKKLGFTILIGGPQATLDAEGTLKQLSLSDWIFCGEPEHQMGEIISTLYNSGDMKKIPGICYVDVDGNHVVREKVVVEKLNNLPFPRMSGLPTNAYWCPDARYTPMTTFMTARGCPHRCGFCASPALLGRKVRKWTAERVVDELEYLVQTYGIREFSFVDDVFTINKKHSNKICELIIARKLDISWFCNSRADQISEESARLAKKAGCHQMYLGFESGHPRILSVVNKDATVEELERGAKILKDVGIARSIGFVVGLPTEDDESIQASIALAHRVQPERIQFTRWTPLVASPLFNKAECRDSTFHNGSSDKIEKWIRNMYDSVEGESWGSPSW